MDNQKPTPRSKPPAPDRPTTKAGAYARKIKPDYNPSSKESRFVGYMVLGFGILAVMSVLLIAANRFGHQGTPAVQDAIVPPNAAIVPPQQPALATGAAPSSPLSPELQGRVARDLLGALPSAPSSSSGASTRYKQPPKDELYFKREPDLNQKDIVGAWQSSVGNSTVVLQLGQGIYQIVMADPSQYSYRQYSSGTYEVLEDLVTLTPRTDWAPPSPPQGTDVVYNAITTAPFPVMVAMKGGAMLWQNPPSTETRIYVPRALPLLQDSGQGYIVWKPIKK